MATVKATKSDGDFRIRVSTRLDCEISLMTLQGYVSCERLGMRGQLKTLKEKVAVERDLRLEQVLSSV